MTTAAKLRIARAVEAAKRCGMPCAYVDVADVEELLTSATDTSAAELPASAHRDEALAASTPSDRGRAAPELDSLAREYSIPGLRGAPR